MNPATPRPAHPSTAPAHPSIAPTTHPDDDYPDQELAWALGVVEDWLLHASTHTLHELADFAYGPTHHGHGHPHLRWIIDQLGVAAAHHHRPPEHDPTDPEPSR